MTLRAFVRAATACASAAHRRREADGGWRKLHGRVTSGCILRPLPLRASDPTIGQTRRSSARQYCSTTTVAMAMTMLGASTIGCPRLDKQLPSASASIWLAIGIGQARAKQLTSYVLPGAWHALAEPHARSLAAEETFLSAIDDPTRLRGEGWQSRAGA